MSEHWYLNVDVRYIDVDTTAELFTHDATGTRRFVEVDIDPLVPGFGYRW